MTHQKYFNHKIHSFFNTNFEFVAKILFVCVQAVEFVVRILLVCQNTFVVSFKGCGICAGGKFCHRCKLQTAHCTVHNHIGKYKVHIRNCKLQTEHCTFDIAYSKVHTAQCKLQTTHCILHIRNCTLHTRCWSLAAKICNKTATATLSSILHQNLKFAEFLFEMVEILPFSQFCNHESKMAMLPGKFSKT